MLAGNWQVGDAIAVASTDFYTSQAEVRTIASISGRTVTVTQPFDNHHYGYRQTWGHPGNGKNYSLDSRAEVANLARNLRVHGSDDALVEGGQYHRQGGHIKIYSDGMAKIANTEFVSFQS